MEPISLDDYGNIKYWQSREGQPPHLNHVVRGDFDAAVALGLGAFVKKEWTPEALKAWEEKEKGDPLFANEVPAIKTSQDVLADLTVWFKSQDVAFRAKYLSAMVAVETSLRTGDIELAAHVVSNIQVSDDADRALVAEALALLGVEE